MFLIDFSNYWKKICRVVGFRYRPFPNILKYCDYRWDLPKQEAFQFILKRSANMYESLASKFFKIIIGIQSGPDVLEETRSVLICLTISKVTETLPNSR